MNVLFVDDHIECANLFADLARERGHRACVASDGIGALQRCAEESFDLILLDIGLPDSDGRDVCHALRTEGLAKRTRIVALTGQAELLGSPCMHEFDGCIVKPVAMQTLQRLLTESESCSFN